MGGFNQGDFNSGDFNGQLSESGLSPTYNPGTGPYSYPQITIAAPLVAPPQVFTNASILLQANIAAVIIFWNGLALTAGLDYTRNGSQVTLVKPPSSGDRVSAAVFARGKQLGGSTPERYIAPWIFMLQGPYDGVGLRYDIVTGPTIVGLCDGVNKLFTVGVMCARMKIFRNGILQTQGLDVATGSVAFVFTPASIPQLGDYLVMFGW